MPAKAAKRDRSAGTRTVPNSTPVAREDDEGDALERITCPSCRADLGLEIANYGNAPEEGA